MAGLTRALPIEKDQPAAGHANEDMFGTQIWMKEAGLMQVPQAFAEQTKEGVPGRRIQSRKVTAAIDCIGFGTKKHKRLSAAVVAGRNQLRAGRAHWLHAPHELGFAHRLGNQAMPVPPIYHPLFPDRPMFALQDGMDRDTADNDRHARHVAIGMAAKHGTRHRQEIVGRRESGLPQEPLVPDIDGDARYHA
jgi:hypothetical protein